MKSGECRECGKRVSAITPACKHCDQVWVKPEKTLSLIVVGIAVLAVVATAVLMALLG